MLLEKYNNGIVEPELETAIAGELENKRKAGVKIYTMAADETEDSLWYEAAARYIEEKKGGDNSLLLLLTDQNSRLDKLKELVGLLEKMGGVEAPLLCAYDVSDDVPVDVLAKTDVLITTKSFRSLQYWDYASDYGVKAVYAGDGDIFW